MNCETLGTLYLKANGELVCDDDFGTRVPLGQLDDGPTEINFADLLRNNRFSHLRTELAAGRAPWPGICEKCAFLRPDEAFVDHLIERRIDKLQIEPSLACNLACPACNVHNQGRDRPGTRHLPVPVFRKFLTDLRQERYRLDALEYCGHGEPLIHPRFSELARTCREIYPQALQRLITNGNFDFAKRIGPEPFEEIFVSCDGARQSSYAQYRIGGEIAKVFDFMAQAVAGARTRGHAVVWKYILFTYNDSDEELMEAQELAQKLGVSTLLFVFTHTPERSLRYKMENAAQIPRLYPNVTVNAHPSFYRDVRELKQIGSWRSSSGVGTAQFNLDQVSLYRDTHLTLSGWAFSDSAVTGLELTHASGQGAFVRAGLSRPDVLEALPQCGTDRSGFWANLKLPEFSSPGPVPLRLTLHRAQGDTLAFDGLFGQPAGTANLLPNS